MKKASVTCEENKKDACPNSKDSPTNDEATRDIPRNNFTLEIDGRSMSFTDEDSYNNAKEIFETKMKNDRKNKRDNEEVNKFVDRFAKDGMSEEDKNGMYDAIMDMMHDKKDRKKDCDEDDKMDEDTEEEKEPKKKDRKKKDRKRDCDEDDKMDEDSDDEDDEDEDKKKDKKSKKDRIINDLKSRVEKLEREHIGFGMSTNHFDSAGAMSWNDYIEETREKSKI